MAVLGLSTAFSPPRGSWIAVRIRQNARSSSLSLRKRRAFAGAATVAVRAEVSFVDEQRGEAAGRRRGVHGAGRPGPEAVREGARQGLRPRPALHREPRQRHWNDHQAPGAQQLRGFVLRALVHQAQPGLCQDSEGQVLAGGQAAACLLGRAQIQGCCRCIGARRLPKSGLHYVRSSDTETRNIRVCWQSELQDAGKAGLVIIQGKISTVLGTVLISALLFITLFPDQAEQLFELAGISL